MSGQVDKAEAPPRVWRLCCRFVRDAKQFNEWGNEEDYELQGGSDEAESASVRVLVCALQLARGLHGRACLRTQH